MLKLCQAESGETGWLLGVVVEIQREATELRAEPRKRPQKQLSRPSNKARHTRADAWIAEVVVKSE